MPRVKHIKKARKDYPNFGIQKGDSYYMWSFNFGPTHKSKTYPKRSQLTQSDFLSQLYDLEDGIDARFSDFLGDTKTPVSDLASSIQEEIGSLVSDIQGLLDETQEKFDNMPEQLQESSDSGQTLQERIDGLESWIFDLEAIALDSDEDPSDDDKEGRIEKIIEEIIQTSSEL